MKDKRKQGSEENRDQNVTRQIGLKYADPEVVRKASKEGREKLREALDILASR